MTPLVIAPSNADLALRNYGNQGGLSISNATGAVSIDYKNGVVVGKPIFGMSFKNPEAPKTAMASIVAAHVTLRTPHEGRVK